MIQQSSQFNTTSLNALFYKQSLLDAQNDYIRSLQDKDFPRFNAVVLTASNEHQAKMFNMQLQARKLPPYTDFIVIPDKNGERVGSGGATLSAIKYLKEKYGSFDGKKFAVIHSGGDSKRTPNYSAVGKLFSPVPRLLPNGSPSTLFDELIIILASIPERIKDGMLLLAGDVMLMFNPLQIDLPRHGATAISFKENAEIGKNHGVFLADSNGNVKKFLHKQTIETLSKFGAINESGNVSIDTGAIIFAPDILEDLYSFVATHDSEAKFINSKIRLSLYGDFLYPLASDSTLDSFYREATDGKFCDELKDVRTAIWNTISKYKLKLLNLTPAKFIHFGTTKEIMNLMGGGWKEYRHIGWGNNINSSLPKNVSGFCSIATNSASIGSNCFFEYSYIHSSAKIGNNCLLSYVELYDETIPDDVVLHTLKQRNGKFVCRIYGVNDNPKEDLLFGKKLTETIFKISDQLWNATLYPECDTARDAVSAALNVYALGNGSGDYEKWASSNKKSLSSGFSDADPIAIIDWQRKVNDLIKMERVLKLIDEQKPINNASNILKTNSLSSVQLEWLKRKLNSLDISSGKGFFTAIRLYWYIGSILNDNDYKAKAFKLISDAVISSDTNCKRFDKSLTIKKNKVEVNLPLRVNWGGGWTDTPPYCLENGGKVLNAAILLNGKLPVKVTITRIPEKKIVLDSKDTDACDRFDSLDTLQNIGDPSDPFLLHKACFIACGVIPEQGGELEQILDRLGGGFEMCSEVAGVPKGSGLGTSSILAAACVKSISEFLGLEYTDDELIRRVLSVEQIMTTGGGWQDQAGGLFKGIKLISSEKGINLKLEEKNITLPDCAKIELSERFCLIYTGQCRLAKNLLRDVVGRYIGNIPESIKAHARIKQLAEQMANALTLGDINCFAQLMNEHWECSKQIDSGTTNTVIEQIFLSLDELIDGRFICGAGGGGFLQVILKKGVTKDDVNNRLKSIFRNFPVRVWDCEIMY